MNRRAFVAVATAAVTLRKLPLEEVRSGVLPPLNMNLGYQISQELLRDVPRTVNLPRGHFKVHYGK